MDLTLSGERTLPGIATENYWFRRHEVAYLAARPWVRGATVLEAGAGDGYGADILSRVAHRVLAVDQDAAACEQAAKAYPQLTVTKANLTALPFADGAIDVVVSLRVVERQADPRSFVAECARVLRPAGTLILSTPNRRTTGSGVYSPAELTDLLEPHFRVDRLYGVHHRGRLRLLDRRYGGIVAAQDASPPATWHPALRRQVASVTHRDFTFTEQDPNGGLDLFAIAVRR